MAKRKDELDVPAKGSNSEIKRQLKESFKQATKAERTGAIPRRMTMTVFDFF